MTPMFYIHEAYCISPQQTFLQVDISTLHEPLEKKMKAIEPAYEGIPGGILRRMGAAARMGVGSAMPILKQTPGINGIIIGTADGGLEDSFKFLNQIVQYDEGLLAPGNFVQSTTNAIAGQLGIISRNKSYNITHVHRGLSFENSIIDAFMQLAGDNNNNYLLGGVDEISEFNYNIENLGGWYKKESITTQELYETNSPGGIAGEGAAMFLVNNNDQQYIAKLQGIATLHSDDEELVIKQLNKFIATYLLKGEKIDLLLSGENGDNRFLRYYESCESALGRDTSVARFKHMTGEYATASAIALWLACHILQEQSLPQHMLKKKIGLAPYKNILIYNNYKGYQHSFMLVSKDV